MLDKLAEHFQKNFYPDMDVSEVRAHLDNPQVLDNGMAHLAETGHDDPQVEEAANIYGMQKLMEGGNDPNSFDTHKKLAETHSKPLVNWFNRQKDFEYGDVLDKKGNPIIDPKTKKPLQKIIKTVTAPDSILNQGFKKTVTNEESINTTPAQRHRGELKLPVPSLWPSMLEAGLLAGITSMPNADPTDKSGTTNVISKGLPILASMYLWHKLQTKASERAKQVGGDGKSLYPFLDSDKFPAPLTLPTVAGLTALGLPYMEKTGIKYNYKTPETTDIVNTRTVEKVKNEDPNVKPILTPRFL